MDAGRRSESATGDRGDGERNGRIRVVSGGSEALGRVEPGTVPRRHSKDRGAPARRRGGRGNRMSAPTGTSDRGHPRSWSGCGRAFRPLDNGAPIAASGILFSIRGTCNGTAL